MHLGFIAMSGLRVCDHELLNLGLSFPAVASRAKEIEALPSLGLLTLAGMIPECHTKEYYEVRDLSRSAVPVHFDVVLISFLSATAKEAYEWASAFREIGTTVILGGLHVTLNPDEAQRHGDCIVIGEGEPVMPQIIDDLEQGRLQARYDAKQGRPFDFQQAPMPAFELLSPERYTRFTVQTQRGCPLSCSFCASSIRLSPTFRVKPVEKVIAEIQMLKTLSNGSPFIEFADDNTFSHRRHARELMKAVAKEEIRWFTETDLSIADDPELLQMIREAGCAEVLIGFESPDVEILNGIETKTNWKAKRADRYLKAIETIQSHGIAVNGCFVLGLDGQTPASFDAVAHFVERSGLFDVQITYLTPFPGTPMHRQLTEEGRILVEGAHERCTLFDINFQPSHMTVEQLRSGFHGLMERLYRPQAVRQRTRQFWSQKRKGVSSDNEAER